MDAYRFIGNRLLNSVVLSLLFLVLISPGLVRAQESPDSYFVIDQSAGTNGRGALFRVDPDTGDRTVVSDDSDTPPPTDDDDDNDNTPPPGQGGPDRYLVIDSNAGTDFRGILFSVDPDTGQRTLVSDFGDGSQGELGNLPTELALEEDGNILAVDSTVGTENRGALFRVDPVTGNRTVISDFGDSSQGELGNSPISVTVVDNGDILVSDRTAGTESSGVLFSVDPVTGSRTVISDFGDSSQGELGPFPGDIAIEADGNILVVSSDGGTQDHGALFRVDPVTGNRTVISDFGDTSQGEFRSIPGEIAVEADGNILFVNIASGIRARSEVFRIDPVTGDRTELSDLGDSAQGDLGSFVSGQGITVEADGDILVVDRGAGTEDRGVLFRVDPVNGNRTVISDFGDRSQGELGLSPDDIVIVPSDDEDDTPPPTDGDDNSTPPTSGDDDDDSDTPPPADGDDDDDSTPPAGDDDDDDDFGDIGQGDLGFNPNDIAIVPFEDEPLDPDTEIAQCTQLNLRLPGSTIDISPFDTRISPGSRRVVYSIGDLYSVPIGGGESVRLTDTDTGGILDNVQISSDGRVVYIADQDEENVLELYRVPIGGGEPVRINDPLTGGEDIDSFRLSSGGRVVYLADQDTPGVDELYSISIDGGETVRLNDPLTEGVGVFRDFKITPDGTRVVYRVAQGGSGAIDLYSVPVEGGEAVRLDDLPTDGGNVDSFELSPDGRVVYQFRGRVSGVVTVYSVPAGGGENVRLIGGRDGIGSGVDSSFRINALEISSDGNRVVYIADQDDRDEFELYSVPIGGGESVRLNGTLTGEGVVDSFEISLDGDTVVYLADQDTGDAFELYSVPIGGGEAVLLSNGVEPERTADSFELTPDGNTVVYLAKLDTSDVFELYSVPVGGGEPFSINSPLTVGGDVDSFRISPDGRVVYRADQDINGVLELYSVSPEGGEVARLSNELVSGRTVNYFRISPNAGNVLYIADQDTDDLFDLYSCDFSFDNGIDDCDPNPCGNGGTCTDNGNSFSCDCSGTGFLGNTCELDINECAVNNGGCSQVCINNEGGFDCGCEEGFELDADGTTCNPVQPEAEICNDNVDNDGDSLIDCDDMDCENDPSCAISPPPPPTGDDVDACVNNPCDLNATCTDLPNPALDNPAGRVCECNEGFAPEAAGATDPVEIVCLELICPALSPPENGGIEPPGAIEENGGGFEGSGVFYLCEDGFELIGGNEEGPDRVCQADGTWSNEPPTCEPTTVPPPIGDDDDDDSTPPVGDDDDDDTPPPVPLPEICNDDTDNDLDGFIDCLDLDCCGNPACENVVGADCEVSPEPLPSEDQISCNDGVDNDGDGLTDCDDMDCENDPLCVLSPPPGDDDDDTTPPPTPGDDDDDDDTPPTTGNDDDDDTVPPPPIGDDDDDDTIPSPVGDDDTPTAEEDDGESGCNTIVGKSPTTMDFAGALLPFMFIPLAVYYRRRKRA